MVTLYPARANSSTVEFCMLPLGRPRRREDGGSLSVMEMVTCAEAEPTRDGFGHVYFDFFFRPPSEWAALRATVKNSWHSSAFRWGSRNRCASGTFAFLSMISS